MGVCVGLGWFEDGPLVQFRFDIQGAMGEKKNVNIQKNVPLTLTHHSGSDCALNEASRSFASPSIGVSGWLLAFYEQR